MVRTHDKRLSRLLHQPVPAPPAWLRHRPLRRGTFTSVLRSPRRTSQLGLLLGIAFGTCFLTGLLSHAIQHPPGWFFSPMGAARAGRHLVCRRRTGRPPSPSFKRQGRR
jgi:hypothetical protein